MLLQRIVESVDQRDTVLTRENPCVHDECLDHSPTTATRI